MEEPKRLAPTTETVRELYLKSGNQCAMPDCESLIMNKEGVFIGQICHIEAALANGERFNKNQNNEERRSFSNLMLLCYPCHKISDNVEEYSVKKLKKIKSDHESKFSDIILKITSSIKDYSKTSELVYPENLLEIDSVLNWRHSTVELEGSLSELILFIKRLKKVPIKTRQLLSVIIDRSKKHSGSLEFSFDEIEEACLISRSDLNKHIGILDRLDFIMEGMSSDFGTTYGRLRELDSGWPIWDDIIEFSKKNVINISEFTESLNFKLFDK